MTKKRGSKNIVGTATKRFITAHVAAKSAAQKGRHSESLRIGSRARRGGVTYVVSGIASDYTRILISEGSRDPRENAVVNSQERWAAVNKLMRNGGSVREFEANEPSYKTDHASAMLVLAKRAGGL